MSQLPAFGEVLRIREEILGETGLLDMVNVAHATQSNAGRGLGSRVPSSDQERDPERFFDLTYPTEDVRQTLFTLSHLSKNPEDVPGTILLNGHYGSGKSHVLLAAYHALSSPQVATRWAKRWGLDDIEIPGGTRVIARNFIQHTAENLWEVFFGELECSDLIEGVTTYPDGEAIERALDCQERVVLIFDELERWYDAVDDKMQSRNRNFIQALTEVAMRDPRLWLLTSVLGENQEPADTIRRTRPLELAFRSSSDRRQVIQYRIFGSYPEDTATTRERVVSSYIDAYASAHLPDLDEYREQMNASYPFTPELLDLLIQKVPNLGGFQATRGTLRFLSHIVRATHTERPIISSQDLPLFDSVITNALSNLDSATGGEIVKRALGDNYEVVGELAHKDELFSTILFYSIADPTHPGATQQQAILAALDPGENPQVMLDSLRQIQEIAFNMHIEDARYVFKTQENPHARINAVSRSQSVTLEACRHIVREQLIARWGSRSHTAIYDGDEEATRRDLADLGRKRPKYILSTRALDAQGRLRLQNLDPNRNLCLLIEPSVRRKQNDAPYNLLTDDVLLAHARRIEACNQLLEAMPSADKRSVYQDVERRERSDLTRTLAERYGFYICWNRAGNSNATADESWYAAEVIPDFEAAAFLRHFRENFSSYPEILDRVRTHWSDFEHRRVRLLTEHFDTTPGLPVPYEHGVIERAVRELVSNGVLSIQTADGLTVGPKGIGSLSEDALARATLIGPQTELPPDPTAEEELVTHEHVFASYDSTKQGVLLEWKVPPSDGGVHYRTLVQRYTNAMGWRTGEIQPVDLDTTHSANRFIGSDSSYLDVQDLTKGAHYFYYVFLVREDATSSRAVLSQRCDVPIPAEQSLLGPGCIEVGFRAGQRKLIAEVEKQIMSSKNTRATTRVRKIEVEIKNIPKSNLQTTFLDRLKLGVDCTSNASLHFEVRGDWARHDILTILGRMERFEGAQYRATIVLKDEDEDG